MRTELVYELECSDESLRSLSSGNIICITPTKYKSMNRERSDFECQCASPKRRSENDQHKSLQICPAVLKAICKAVNTSQERKCAPCCSQAGAGSSDSVVRIRIPQGVQYDHEVQKPSQTFCPQICFISSSDPPPERPSIQKTSSIKNSLCPPSCFSQCPPPPCYQQGSTRNEFYRSGPPPDESWRNVPPTTEAPSYEQNNRYPAPSRMEYPVDTSQAFNTTQPFNDFNQDFDTTMQPSDTSSQPLNTTPQPLNTAPQPFNTTPQPFDTTSQPFDSTYQPCPPSCQRYALSPPPTSNRPYTSPYTSRYQPPLKSSPPATGRYCPPTCPFSIPQSSSKPYIPSNPSNCPPQCPSQCPPPPCSPLQPTSSPPIASSFNRSYQPPSPVPCMPCPSQCPPPQSRPYTPPSPSPISSSFSKHVPTSASTCRPCPPCCRPSVSTSPPPCKPCHPCQQGYSSSTSDSYQSSSSPSSLCSKCCKSKSYKLFQVCKPCCPSKSSCKPFPLRSRSKTPTRSVYYEVSQRRTPTSSRCSIEDCPFRNEKPPSAPPGCQCSSKRRGPSPAQDFSFNVLHVPCKLCGIPPCAALSSVNCSTCIQCRRKNQVKNSESNSSKTQKNNFKISNTSSNFISNESSKYVSKLSDSTKKVILCKPCEEDFQEDNSFDSKDNTPESSPSVSSIPSGTVPAGESESCESLDYPCKPLKPKVSAIKEDPSEESFTCPSKRVICPAKPPPCPGAGDKPCPSFPAKPCPSRRRTNLEEPQGSISTKSERHCKDRRRSRENESILLPVSIQSQSPIDQIDNNSKISNPSEISSRDFQTLDQIPSGPIFSPSKPEENFPTKNQPEEKFPPKNEPEVYMYQTEDQDVLTQPSGCSCGLETCKCNQTSTHEEKIIQCPAFKQCTCQTETKDDANVQCSCKEDVALSCQCKEPYEGRKVICECKPSTTSSSSKSNAGSDSVMSCICCKRGKILKNIINQIPLCEPCHKINRKNFYPHDYCNPLHSCMCYKLIDRNLLCQFKQTLTELERLDIYQQYCEILKNCKCCKKCGCKCKLPKKFKNGCAYFLKLEEACPNTECEGEGSFNSFNTEEDQENYLPEVTMKVPNCRASCARRKGRNGAAAKKYWSCPSIQNYLCTMKPEFVARAENRRRILRDATIQREENSDKRKLNFIDKVNYLNQRRAEKVSSETDILKPYGYQTKTYCVFDIELNESPKKVQPRVFKSFKEMKELTRRKYLHLNEVKNKKNVYREQRLREANRLLANTFTRRLQKSTLKGAVDIPLNVKVISY